MVDMCPAAVTERLQRVSELLARRGWIRKGAEMSPEALTARLKVLGALSDMCRKLQVVGRGLYEQSE